MVHIKKKILKNKKASLEITLMQYFYKMCWFSPRAHAIMSSGHFRLVGSFLHKSILKIMFYEYFGIKMSTFQA